MLVHRLKKRNFIDFFFFHNSPCCSVHAALVIDAEAYNDDTIPTITGK